MPDSATTAHQVRDRFREGAEKFDDLYEDERPLVRLLRPGLFRRRELAVSTVRELAAPGVLDVGCGSGRIGEFVLEAGATRYLGVDFAEPMIDLARDRLARYGERVRLVAADFIQTPIEERFDVVLALGFFDYIPKPEPFVQRMAELCSPGGAAVASFPRWSWTKGPVRKIRYEWIGDCPIFDYTAEGIERLFGAAGFDRVELFTPSRHGYLMRAWKPGSPDRPEAPSAAPA